MGDEDRRLLLLKNFLPLQTNWLKAQGVGKGDFVSIYMPMICELPIAMVSLCSPPALPASHLTLQGTLFYLVRLLYSAWPQSRMPCRSLLCLLASLTVCSEQVSVPAPVPVPVSRPPSLPALPAARMCPHRRNPRCGVWRLLC